MNAKLIKSLSVFTDAELFEISDNYFGYKPNDICKVIDRIESAMYFGEFCLDDVIKEYGKTNLADERPERVPKHYIINKFQNKGIFECVQHCESGETLLTGSFIGGAKVYTFIKTEFDLEQVNEQLTTI